MAQLDDSALRAAVVHALTMPTGRERALSGEWLLREGLPAETRQTTGRAAAGPGKTTVSVSVIDPVETDTHLIMTTLERIECSVVVTVRRYANPRHSAELARARVWLLEYERRARGALTYPGALDTAPNGESTGLDGQSLRTDGGRYRAQGPRHVAGQHLVELVMTFRCSVERARPS